MKWPWQETVVQDEDHEAVSERLDSVEEDMKSMAHRILLLEVELGLYDPEHEVQTSESRKG